MSAYSSVDDHREMFFDARNRYYADAISKLVHKDSVVLDLGAGLGIHGFMAARNGARKTYMVEPAPILDITQQLVELNKLAERVECLSGKIEELDLPEKVDLIVSVFTGNFLLAEDLLPSLFYARDKFLKPGGKLIPDRASMHVAPVFMPQYYAKYIDCWADAWLGLSLQTVHKYAANRLYYDSAENWDATFLSAPAALLDLDFMTATKAACRNRIDFEITQAEQCHGWLGWFEMRLGDSWLSTAPDKPQTHWRQVFLPLSRPVTVKKGDTLTLDLGRPAHGEWTWTTFFSAPASLSNLKKNPIKTGPAYPRMARQHNGYYFCSTVIFLQLKPSIA